MLADTSRFLSGLTDYAAVVVRQVDDPARVRSVQLVCLGPSVVLVVARPGSGAIEKRTVELTDDPERAAVAAAYRPPRPRIWSGETVAGPWRCRASETRRWTRSSTRR